MDVISQAVMDVASQVLRNWHAGHTIVYAIRLALLKAEIVKLTGKKSRTKLLKKAKPQCRYRN